ncbi:MAG: hypothetical protein [Olavius algarvensis Gamma 3 endosymbiont]|nr:MAG: hypothetical protein [Olavius algarvensis Gamma 3 endosymbiont]
MVHRRRLGLQSGMVQSLATAIHRKIEEEGHSKCDPEF